LELVDEVTESTVNVDALTDLVAILLVRYHTHRSQA